MSASKRNVAACFAQARHCPGLALSKVRTLQGTCPACRGICTRLPLVAGPSQQRRVLAQPLVCPNSTPPHLLQSPAGEGGELLLLQPGRLGRQDMQHCPKLAGVGSAVAGVLRDCAGP
eukprot:366562-Chlamydomonas_euryale.AAC.4